MRRFLLLFAVMLLPATSATAERHLVRIPAKSAYWVQELDERGIDVIAVTRDGIDVVVDDKGLSFLRTQRYPVTVLESENDVSRTTPVDPGTDLGLYTTYAELGARISSLVATYPALVDSFSIGTSIEGRTQYALKISDNVGVDEGEAEVLIMANLHARELMTVEIAITFAEYLLGNYGGDATVTEMIDEREIYIIPMLNPDGHVYVENNHGGAWWTWWRKNRRNNGGSFGVDLNRNFGNNWGLDDVGSSPTPSSDLYRGTGPFSEPETANLRAFVNSRNFTVWFSYHSYGELLLYPPGYAYEYTPDHNIYFGLGEYLTESNGYLDGNPAMGAIYLTNGDSDDWGYYETGEHGKVYAFTPEVNSVAQGGFGPCDTLIAPTFDLLLEMNMRLLEVADNPAKVVGPYDPVLDPVANPYGNGIHELTWNDNDPGDPNPVATWEVERCLAPSWFQDNATPAGTGWTFDGFSYDPTGGHSGAGYFSGAGDNLSNSMTMANAYVVDSGSDTLTFWTSYDIETDWDYAFVEVSDDGGLTWTPIAGNITTNTNPNGNNRGNGITGASAGWIQAIFPMTAYAGQDVLVRFTYITDGAVVNPGFRVDEINPVPSCATTTTVASGLISPEHVVIPDFAATYRYRVRAIDNDGDASNWSNSEDFTVSSTTGASVAAFVSRLGQNYPNPFNPQTTIPFVVGGVRNSASQRVTLTVYGVTGARVAVLIDADISAGSHTATWKGLDEAGRAVPTGVYFARLSVGGDPVLTRKLVLLK